VSDFDDDAAALVQVADELVAHQRIEGNLTIELPPIAALQLGSLLQLVLRRVTLTPATRTLAGALLVLVREYFADCPAVLAYLDADDPADPDAHRPGTFSTNTRH
jgi:hypothetical protein